MVPKPAVHVSRKYVVSMSSEKGMLKLDFSNAFNSLRRDVLLKVVRDKLPKIYNFCLASYDEASFLFFENKLILSDEGIQQGDPLRPLFFSLAVHPILQLLESEVTIGFLDDFSCFGDLEVLAQDISRVDQLSKAMGLNLNLRKCEIITEAHQSALPTILQSLIYLNTEEASLLGAPITTGQAMNTILQAKCADLARARERLPLIAAHDALLILRKLVGASKLLYILKCSPCAGHPALEVFDEHLRSALSTIANCQLTDMDPGESSSGERRSWH